MTVHKSIRLVVAAILPLGVIFALVPNQVSAQRGQVEVTKVEYQGWKNNLRIRNADAELIITLDVGPRILSYRLLNGANVFHEYAKELGKSGEKEWMIRGGHRLWVAPEEPGRTYVLDNGPVEATQMRATGDAVIRTLADREYGIEKELLVTLEPKGSRVKVVHILKNRGKQPTELAPWALSVMAPGGVEIIPLPAKFDHPDNPKDAKSAKDYAPNQKLVLWPFFDFKDPRATFGSKYITLRQHSDPKRKPTKFGLAHEMGWVGYLNHGTLFVKRITYQGGKTYPDRGCNFETWTDPDMLEVESLGPLVRLKPGESVEHVETWELFPNVADVKDEAAIDKDILPLIKR